VYRKLTQALPVFAAVVLAACSNGATNQSLLPQNSGLGSQAASSSADAFIEPGSGEIPFRTANPVRRLCAPPGDPNVMECLALVRTDVAPVVQMDEQIGGDSEQCPFTQNAGYCPIDLQNAYLLPSLKAGGGKTVAIVDAYGYHHAASDLAFFRKTMGLKACTTGTGCLRIVNQEGHTSPLPGEPPPSDDWKGEESLDLDMVSGICPNCKIILVQTNNNLTSNLYAGVKTAGVTLHAKYIGASWGSGPEGSPNSIFHQAGVVIAAAAGDQGGGGRYGGGPIQPCTYEYVVCVGGTHLVRDAHNKRGWGESVWNDLNYDQCYGPCGATGSACSTKISKPPWQTDIGCHNRSAADTSATASLRAPVIVYNSEEGCTPPQCFFDFGGTSASTQIIIGVYALAGNAASQQGGTYLWKHHKDHLYDVLTGNNVDPAIGSTCASSVHYVCYARAGYDGPTGLGTPKGVTAF
jgi:subtilase family serine protease